MLPNNIYKHIHNITKRKNFNKLPSQVYIQLKYAVITFVSTVSKWFLQTQCFVLELRISKVSRKILQF